MQSSFDPFVLSVLTPESEGGKLVDRAALPPRENSSALVQTPFRLL
jgi:hypothetical protein